MTEIKRIPEEDIGAFAMITANAYPGIKINIEELTERLVKSYQEGSPLNLYGLYRDNKLLGGMRLHDFKMNMLSTKLLVGGVGSVAVDLLHKKEKVAKELIHYYLQHYKQLGAHMAALYPFRLDFYKQMGFGYGTKMDSYRFTPSALPKGKSKNHIQFISKEEKPLLLDCYQRFCEQTHGMMDKTMSELNGLFNNQEHKIVGYKKGDQIFGYIVFTFKKAHEENFGKNDIVIKEIIYETTEALSELLTLLHSQADQVNRIILHTQDEYFHHLLSDPRNDTDRLIPHVYHESHTSGVGIMYRVTDIRGIFTDLKDHNFGGQTCKLKLTIKDTFFPENDGSTVIHFNQGIATIYPDGGHDVEIQLDISDFSSLLMGCADFKSLVRYGLVQISDTNYVSVLNKLFLADRPICTTGF
jgi:predicted acetyltransferase